MLSFKWIQLLPATLCRIISSRKSARTQICNPPRPSWFRIQGKQSVHWVKSLWFTKTPSSSCSWTSMWWTYLASQTYLDCQTQVVCRCCTLTRRAWQRSPISNPHLTCETVTRYRRQYLSPRMTCWRTINQFFRGLGNVGKPVSFVLDPHVRPSASTNTPYSGHQTRASKAEAWRNGAWWKTGQSRGTHRLVLQHDGGRTNQVGRLHQDSPLSWPKSNDQQGNRDPKVHCADFGRNSAGVGNSQAQVLHYRRCAGWIHASSPLPTVQPGHYDAYTMGEGTDGCAFLTVSRQPLKSSRCGCRKPWMVSTVSATLPTTSLFMGLVTRPPKQKLTMIATCERCLAERKNETWSWTPPRFSLNSFSWNSWGTTSRRMVSHPILPKSMLSFNFHNPPTCQLYSAFSAWPTISMPFAQIYRRWSIRFSSSLEKTLIFSGSSVHTSAFEAARKLIADAPCLAFFDQHKPVTLQVDASDYGLGGALMQADSSGKLQPVAYMSCQLKPNEVQWAQIEKEALAICAACTKWDLWLNGKAVTVHSDHQALETIFKKPLAKAPKRLQRIMFRLQRYTINVIYRKGTSLVLADTLSRAPLNVSNDASPTNFDLFRLNVERQDLQPNVHLTSLYSQGHATRHCFGSGHEPTVASGYDWLAIIESVIASVPDTILVDAWWALHRWWYPLPRAASAGFRLVSALQCWRKFTRHTWVRTATIACAVTSSTGPEWSRPFRTSVRHVVSVHSMVLSNPGSPCNPCPFHNSLGNSSAKIFFITTRVRTW